MPQKRRDNIGSKTFHVLLDKQFWVLQFATLSTLSLRKTKKPQTIPFLSMVLLLVSSMLILPAEKCMNFKAGEES